jgi:hypothetical protein
MIENKNWKKWIMWALPIYFLASAGKELYLCQVLAEAQGLSLNDVFQFWFSDQLKTYETLHVRALLRMQSAFYMVLISFVFSVWVFTGEQFKNQSSETGVSSKNS